MSRPSLPPRRRHASPRRSRLLVALAAALTLGVVAACGSGPGPGGDSGGASGSADGGGSGSHHLTVWHAYVGQEDKVKFMTQTLDAFKQAHPEITLDVVGLEQNAYKTKLQTAMAAHQVPDVFYTLPGGYLQNFVKSGEVYALDSELAKNGWGDSFFPTALQQVQYDGKTYAVPIDTDSTVVWYNKALFDQHGWQIPKTWDEFMALCQTIKDSGVAPIALGNKDAWPATFWFQYPVLRMQGPGVIQKFNSGDASATFGDGGRKALEMMQSLSQNEYFTKGFNGMSDQDANLLFLNSKAAMVLNGTWQIGSSADAPAGFELGYFPFPTISGADEKYSSDVIAGVAAAFAIAESSQNKPDAVTFLQFLSSKEVMTNYVDIRKTMVNVKDATTEAAAGPVLYGIVNDIVGKAEALDPFYDTSMPPKAMQAYYNTLQGVLDGSITPDAGSQALETAMKAQE